MKIVETRADNYEYTSSKIDMDTACGTKHVMQVTNGYL